MERLTRSLREAPVVSRDGYPYFVHPVTDGIPLVEPALLREIAAGVGRVTDLDAVDKILTAESMGIHHASAVALTADLPFVVARKRQYGFEDEVCVHQITGYGESELYVNNIREGDRILLLDDVFATGSTLTALYDAVVETGAEVVDAVVVIRRSTDEAVEEPPAGVKHLVEVDVVDGEVVIRDTA